MGSLSRKIRNLIVRKILCLNDTPHAIALGIAIGVFVAWTPTIPFQMLSALFISVLLGANKLVAQPIVWITNPVTLVPIYWFNFFVGCLVLPGEYSGQKFVELLKQAVQHDGAFTEQMRLSWEVIVAFFWPLWIGSMLVGLILAVPSYFISYRAIVAYRKHYEAKYGDAFANL